MPKVRNAELSFLYATHRLVLFCISTKYQQNICVTEQTLNLFQTKQREMTPKVRKPELPFLYGTLNLVLFYISTKYHKNIPKVFNLQSGHEIKALSMSNITKGNNAESKKGRLVILVQDTSSHPVLHFYQVPSKYSEGYLSYRVDLKPTSNKTKGNNPQSKKARDVILVHDMSSCPVLHFYQVSSKYSKGYSSYRADKKLNTNAEASGIGPI